MCNFAYRKVFLFFLVSIFSIYLPAQHSKREMRGVWIATVANIDWPSRPGLMVYEQRNEMRRMLDELAKNKINCIVLQIRPTADALYASQLEPWSHWLTGGQGKKPHPYYDPLQFVIEEAHKRCMDVHVWLNPYRVLNNDDLKQLSKEHLYHKNKKLFVKYGGRYYFDPGLDETRQFLNKVVEDIVERYDIDAIHFDDYFYPYPVDGEKFPDDESFKNNPRGFAPNQKDDWRRNNINLVIGELQQTIKNVKPWVEFGVSPFGVWRNNSVDPRGSATRAGVQNYDDLYADILKWLREGTIDYVVPQLYWEIGKEVADYKVLLKWWSENSCGKNLYIGQYVSGLNANANKAPAWRKPNELARQIRLNKTYPQVDGSVFFSAKYFVRNIQGFNDSLQHNFYKYPALCPVNRNISGEASAQPQNLQTLKDGKEMYLLWDAVEDEGGCQAAYYVVYAFKGKKAGDMNNPEHIIARTTETCFDLNSLQKPFKGNYTFVVTAVNRYKHESIPAYGITRKL
jgi:uncharacterized lipoprotein YddW (UPF0748 family)